MLPYSSLHLSVPSDYFVKNKSIISCCSAPSNIAIIKYWGKTGEQLPINPSLSFTLKHSVTSMKIECFVKKSSNEKQVELFLNSEKNEKFAQKFEVYLERFTKYLPYLKDLKFIVHTKNSFPHSAGIASSASSASAFAFLILDIEKKIFGKEKSDFYERCSFFSRLASGSACRSVYPGWVSWGGGSDLYASPIKEIHPIFYDICDTILVVDKKEKSVSSSLGHDLMNCNPFKKERIELANDHYLKLCDSLKKGNWEDVGFIAEKEALMLHALMMTSNPPYMLLSPKSVELIAKIYDFRKETGVKCFFTMDAGPNLHLLYLKQDKHVIEKFVSAIDIEQIIWDEIGLESIKAE